MVMSRVIDRLAEALATEPDALLALSAIGSRRPATGSDLPALTVSLVVDGSRGSGLGRYVGSADGVVSSQAVVVASASPETFSADLRRLRLSPRPVRKNPASTREGFSADDVQIDNVTGPGNPVNYRLTDSPTLRSEFRLEVETAEVAFGAAQTPGDRLDVRHWTIAPREDITGDRYRGTVLLEAYTTSAASTADLSRRLQVRIRTQGDLLRQKGFPALQPTGLDPLESVTLTSLSGSAVAAWKQSLRYRFVFEGAEGGGPSSGIPIERIDVDVPRPSESFSVP